MTWLRYCIALVFLILFTSAAQAGKDPIGWSLAGSLPAQTIVNEQYKLTYTLVNNLPFKMPTPLIIAKHISGEFTVVDGCTGLKLTPGQTCIVGITFFPTSAGLKSVQIDEEYGANVVPLPKLTTTASVSTKPLITGIVTTDLPPNIGTGEHRPVSFKFINNGNGTVLGPFTSSTSLLPTDDLSFHVDNLTSTCPPAAPLGSLGPGASCVINGTLSAKNVRSYAVSATLNYTGGSTTVTTSTTLASQLVTVAANPALPSQIAAGSATTVGFTYTNTGTQAVFGAPFSAPNITDTITVILSPSTSVTCTLVGTDTCNGTSSLGAGASCNRTCSFTPTATGTYTVTGTFNYDGPSKSLQETTNAGRQFTINNFCNYDVWYSFNGAAVGPSCTVPSDCPAGSTCSSGLCYWINPSPTSGTFHLAPLVGTSTVIIPDVSPTTTVWNGSFAGRTLCSSTTTPPSCATANCNASWGGDSAPCDVGTPFSSPSTVEQLTLVRNNSDTYLVNLTNGITVPTSIVPNTTGPVGSPYVCGTPGSVHALNGEGACNWNNYSSLIPGVYFQWTKLLPSAVACTTNATCTVINPSYVCGLSYNPMAATGSKLAETCGPLLGYWSANEACITDPGSASPFFGCDLALSAPLNGYTAANLYSCSPVTPGGNFDSCYNAGAMATCCGCQNWDQPPTSLSTPPTPTKTQACANNNSQWDILLIALSWMKQGCPSAQVYPDDTASSIFSCPATPVTNNIVNYTITFCPT